MPHTCSLRHKSIQAQVCETLYESRRAYILAGTTQKAIKTPNCCDLLDTATTKLMKQSSTGSTHVNIWQRQVDNPVESARPGKGRVQGSRPVGSSHDHHACVVLKPIHLCQQLVDSVH